MEYQGPNPSIMSRSIAGLLSVGLFYSAQIDIFGLRKVKSFVSSGEKNRIRSSLLT